MIGFIPRLDKRLGSMRGTIPATNGMSSHWVLSHSMNTNGHDFSLEVRVQFDYSGQPDRIMCFLYHEDSHGDAEEIYLSREEWENRRNSIVDHEQVSIERAEEMLDELRVRDPQWCHTMGWPIQPFFRMIEYWKALRTMFDLSATM